MKTKYTLGCLIAALLPAILATPALAVDLLKQYPTHLVKGDAEPEHARAWEFQNQDVVRISHFSLEVGNELKVETGAADLGIGHCADGAVWAVLLPREPGTLTSSVAKKEEAIAHIWLRFHPAQIDRIFSPALVSADGNADVAGAMRAIANAKMTSSWQANGKAMIPEPNDMTVYIDTKDGSHRFFMVDTKARTAEYVAAFNGSSADSPMSWASAPPVVIKTVPEAGATGVAPGVTEIRVTFSKEMMDQSWSWCDVWENSTPEDVEKPKYDADHKTCVLKVRLEPDKAYGYWLNTKSYRNFKDKDGHAAVPYLLTFQTAANGQLSPGQAASPDVRIDPQTGMPMSKTGGLPPAASAAYAAYATANEVRDLVANGQYDDALQRCLSFHDQYKASGALFQVLADWVELGRRYPKARESLIEIRDHDVSEFSAGRGYADLFSEVNSINGALHQDNATYDLFKLIREQDPDLAQQCYFYVESLLVAKGEYKWCYDHMGDPQGRFDSIHQSLTMQLDNQKRMTEIHQQSARRIAEMNQRNGWTNAYSPPDTSAMMKKSAENGFVGQTRQLIEILVATGHQADAEKIRDQAVAVLDNPRLQSAVSDATEKLHKNADAKEKRLHLNLSLEDNRAGNIKVEFKTGSLNDQIKKTMGDLNPGSTDVALSELPDGEYYVYFSSPGYAAQWQQLSVKGGKIEPAELKGQLFRKRYVVLRWAFNLAGGREFSGTNVQTGRVTLAHWEGLPYFGRDWQIWQKSSDGGMFGDAPFLDFHRFSPGYGFSKAPASVSFDDLKEAPTDARYECASVKAEKGLMLFCRVNGNQEQGIGYGKIVVEDVTETPPTEIKH